MIIVMVGKYERRVNKMSEKEILEMIEYINNMNKKDFCKMLDDVEKDILTKDTYKKLKESEE